MFYNDHRLSIVIGAYGSGKSEISVNMSLAQRRDNPNSRLLIADMDIVNPFYRSADCAPELEKNNIKYVDALKEVVNILVDGIAVR